MSRRKCLFFHIVIISLYVYLNIYNLTTPALKQKLLNISFNSNRLVQTRVLVMSETVTIFGMIFLSDIINQMITGVLNPEEKQD